MAIRLKRHSPAGESKWWTLREVLQGKPVERPSHPMLVHFPIAFYSAALGLDLLSRIGTHPSAPLAATWLIEAALVGFVAAAVTGLAERTTMAPGSKIRRIATRHMWFQYTAAAVFAVNLAVRWSGRHDPRASVWWITLDAIGVLIMVVGADIGGRMVYTIGYRGLGGD